MVGSGNIVGGGGAGRHYGGGMGDGVVVEGNADSLWMGDAMGEPPLDVRG